MEIRSSISSQMQTSKTHVISNEAPRTPFFVWREFLWGAIAGAFGEGMMHPIDTVKTRIQSHAFISGSQSQKSIQQMVRAISVSDGVRDDLVKKLKVNGTNVYLISGGFRQMINPLASILGISLENIYANQLLFGSFDASEANGYKNVIMIGDVATDLEARKPGGAELFICYAGVQHREAVATKADWLVYNFKDLISSLE